MHLCLLSNHNISSLVSPSTSNGLILPHRHVKCQRPFFHPCVSPFELPTTLTVDYSFTVNGFSFRSPFCYCCRASGYRVYIMVRWVGGGTSPPAGWTWSWTRSRDTQTTALDVWWCVRVLSRRSCPMLFFNRFVVRLLRFREGMDGRSKRNKATLAGSMFMVTYCWVVTHIHTHPSLWCGVSAKVMKDE